MALQLIFGMTCSNLCIYLRFGHRVIVEALKSDSLTQIVIPSNEKIASYKEIVGAMYPLLSDAWSTMDGLKLYLQQSGNTEIQARFYNGWMHGHYMSPLAKEIAPPPLPYGQPPSNSARSSAAPSSSP